MRHHLGLDHIYHPRCHVIKHFRQPFLSLGASRRHIDFNHPKLQILVNHKVKAEQLKRVYAVLNHFGHLRQSRFDYVVDLRQEEVFPSKFTVFLWVLLLQVSNEIIAAHDQLAIFLHTVVRDVSLSIFKLGQVEM